MVILNVTGEIGTIPKGWLKGLEELEISGDHSGYIFIKIYQNTEKSHGDLRILAVIQTPVKNHQLTLM